MESDNSVSIQAAPNGRGFVLTCERFVPAPLGRVFEFFSDAFQLQRITPPWLNFQVLTPAPIVIQAGTEIDYRLRLRGLPLRWRSVISVWEPPYRFVDEQVRGPYKRWYHEHTFEQHSGGTLCRDAVSYAVYGGALVHTLFVRSDLRRIFAYRSAELGRIFGTLDVEPPRVQSGCAAPAL